MEEGEGWMKDTSPVSRLIMYLTRLNPIGLFWFLFLFYVHVFVSMY